MIPNKYDIYPIVKRVIDEVFGDAPAIQQPHRSVFAGYNRDSLIRAGLIPAVPPFTVVIRGRTSSPVITIESEDGQTRK
jgi:hypothetical protein